MHKTLALLFLSIGVPAFAATYTVPAGSKTAAIQAIVNTAGSSPGNTVVFSAGAYSLTTMVTLPCSNATVYTGPNVGIVNQNNLPKAVLSSTVPTNYAFSTDSNGTSFTSGEGCTIEYLRFTGTQGGIFVDAPGSGIIIQENAFDNNNPPAGGCCSQANIYLDGDNTNASPATGNQHISILWNTFFDNCAAVRAQAWPDSGGGCSATWVNAYNNYLTWSNNTINLTEEGLKLSEQATLAMSSLNADVENNNMQGNSRIMIESQQDTNGVGTYSHNAFYQPYNPSYNTFELSIPEYTPSISPTHTATDNVYIGNVPVTITGSGAHYGIGLELWGAGSIATNSLYQGGNGPDTCDAGWGCSGWEITIGEPFTNATVTGNYFSGFDSWTGTANDSSVAIGYEDGGSISNPGLDLSDNTVVETSTTIPTVAPEISITPGSGGYTATISDSDTKHGLSFFYTVDGTTPAIFVPGGSAGTSRLYTAPFTVPQGTTVKALASWGQGANQGITFPVFGYVPSNVVTAQVSATGRTLVSVSLRPKVSTSKLNMGSTLQFTAYGTYSDGSVSALPDTQGNKVTAWNTSNHKVAKVSTLGHVTAIANGPVQIEATVGTMKAASYNLTVAQPVTIAAQTTATAEVQASATAEVQPGTTAETQSSSSTNAQASSSTDAQAGGTPATESAPAAVNPGPMPAAPAAPLPDGFVGPFWRLVTPAGGSASISNSHLFIGVPGGSNHDAVLPSNQAVRVVQTIGSQDFDVAIKIDSLLVAADGDTSQGLMVLHDDEDFIAFALVTNGTRIGLNAQTVSNGVATTVLDDEDFSQYQNPIYLRLAKSGSSYVAFYSVDGVNWTQAASFSDSMTTTSIGPFASNYSSTPGNASPVVMSVNWFDLLQ